MLSPRKALGVTSLTLTLSSFLFSLPVQSQIIPDNTLGPEQTQVIPGGAIANNEAVDLIQSGARRGANLFHSFEQFNIEVGQRVYFDNPTGVDRILSRVTGEFSSNIDGTLGSLGSADIFLINPNGIVFGPNARLDIAGSFVATTADAFKFADGSTFSAVNPEAPPLLTMNLAPGVQYGQPVANQGVGDRPIESAGLLRVGESLTLAGGDLRLSGQLEAGDHLRLRAEDTVQIRDDEAMPFRAIANGNIRIRGTNSIDISALSHPESGVVAGQNVTLRSDAPAIIDAHFAVGRDFRIEQLNGERGRSLSLDDPIIRADGDVSFQDYTGASLHILAGGSVTIPGPITITGADTVGNAIQEQVTLSDGETVVDIDGSAEPTLDVRAGLRLRSVTASGGDRFHNINRSRSRSVSGAERSGDIVLGDISNPGGTVLVTNQYRPNRALAGGDIQLGTIDTSVERVTDGTARGGDIFLDSRGDIDITGPVTTAARAGSFRLDSFGEAVADRAFSPTIDFAGNRVRTFGGDIVLLSGHNITTQSLDTSAIAAARSTAIRTLRADGTERVQQGEAIAIARGGMVTVSTAVDRRNQTVGESLGNIETGTINTSARAFAKASANASLRRDVNLDEANSTLVNTDNAGEAIGGSVTTRSEGGPISLGSQTVTGRIAAPSDVGRIRTDTLNSSVSVRADASADANVIVSAVNAINSGNGGESTGGIIGDIVSRSGEITLSTDVTTGEINAESTIGSIESSRIDANVLAGAYAIAIAGVDAMAQEADNRGNGGIAIGGTVGQFSSQGGTIRLAADTTTGNIMARSDIGNIQTGRIGARAYATSQASAISYADATASGYATLVARNRGHSGNTTGGTIGNMLSQGGSIILDTQVVTGHILAPSDIGQHTAETIDASALSQGSTYALTSSDADAYLGAYLGYGSAAAQDLVSFVSAENNGDAVEAQGGNIGDMTSIGGHLSISADVIAGDIAVESDVGNIRTETVNVSAALIPQADSLMSTGAAAGAPNAEARNSGASGTSQAGRIGTILAQGGPVEIATNIQLGTISSGSDIGNLRTGKTDTSVYTVASSNANSNAYSRVTAFNFPGTAIQIRAENEGDAGTAQGGTVDSASFVAGPVTLATVVSTGDIHGRSDIGRLQAGTIDTYSLGRVNAGADTYADARGNGPDFVDPSTVSIETDNSGDGGLSTGGTLSALSVESGTVMLSTQISTSGTIQGPRIGTLESARIITTSTALADVSARARTSALSLALNTVLFGRDTGEPGRGKRGTATATAGGGNIVLTTDLSSESSAQRPSRSGEIINNAAINSFARALVDVFAEGTDSPPDPVNFEALGGSITMDSDGPIQLGERSQLDASASFFVIRALDTIASDGAELQGGKFLFTAQGPIVLNQINAETNAEFEIDGVRITVEALASAGGELDIRTPDVVRLRDRASISVAATGGTGEAGDITIGAQSLVFGEQSTLSSQTQSGNGGDISITLGPDLGELLILGPASSISTTAGTQAQGGDGGNINIDARFLVTLDQNNSDITANAFTGNGGRVQIVSDGLFGIAFREQPTDLSDITASSTFGTSGDVTIEAPDTDPNQAIAELPSAFVAPEVVQSCREQFTQTQSQFTITGRGGLPASPTTALGSVILWQDILPIESLPIEYQNNSVEESPVDSRLNHGPTLIAHPGLSDTGAENSSSRAIAEAQRWQSTPDGNVMLVTHHSDPTKTLLNPVAYRCTQ